MLCTKFLDILYAIANNILFSDQSFEYVQTYYMYACSSDVHRNYWNIGKDLLKC